MSEAPPATEDKRVTWAELFFDLVFVFAVTQVSALLHDDHSPLGVARALVVFVPIYWAWVGTSIHSDTHDVERPGQRLGIFTIGLCALFMALATPLAYGDRGWLFAAAYYIARLTLAFLMTRGRGFSWSPFTVAVLVSGPLLVIGTAFDGPLRLALWALAAAIDLISPRALRGRMLLLRFDAGHMPERFGLLLLIALGESVVATGLPAARAEHLTAGTLAAVAATFVLICSLWWVYYHFAADAVRHALATSETQADIVRAVLSYGHLMLISGVIAFAAGLAEVITHPGEHLHLGTAAVLFGGCALYLAAFGYTRWRMFRKISRTRLTAAALVLALLPLAPLIPALAALCVVAGVTIALNAVEYLAVRQGVPL